LYIYYITFLKKTKLFMIKHLAIIMDWNRRWARKRLMPAIAWHKAWADNVEKIADLAWEKWIKYLTLWALSTDNLKKREEKEVKTIIKLINNIENYLWSMIKKWLKFQVIGDINQLPKDSIEILNKVTGETKNNSWILLTLALIYWWQDEIVRATKKIIKSWLDPDALNREEFRKYLDTSILPNPDVIVRTGWDIRHSGFLLYDSEYSEYYFTKKWWPEYDEIELDKTINFFNKSKRNFGK